jgi:hypothetical protein
LLGVRDRDVGSVGLQPVRPGQLRRQARDARRLARRRSRFRRVRLRHHPLPGPARLVQGRRNERVLADVGRAAVQGAVVNSAYVYGNGISYRDITSGNNGASCLVGFDLCSGRGSWIG